MRLVLAEAVKHSWDTNVTCAYLSSPLMTGGGTLEENIKLADEHATWLWRRFGEPVINPAKIYPKEGVDPESWGEFWESVIKKSVRVMTMAPGWEQSVECQKERELAKKLRINVTSLERLIEEVKRMPESSYFVV